MRTPYVHPTYTLRIPYVYHTYTLRIPYVHPTYARQSIDTNEVRRCRAYIFLGVINYSTDVSAHARQM